MRCALSPWETTAGKTFQVLIFVVVFVLVFVHVFCACAVLAILCLAVPRCAMLCRAVPRCAMLCHAVPCCEG